MKRLIWKHEDPSVHSRTHAKMDTIPGVSVITVRLSMQRRQEHALLVPRSAS